MPGLTSGAGTRGGVGSQALRRQEGQVPMVLTEVGSQGRAQLCRYYSRRTEPVVEGPFVRVPWASVRYTLRGVLEFCHCNRGHGYPWSRQRCRGDGGEGGRRHLGPLPLGVCRRRKHPHDGGRPHPSALQMAQCQRGAHPKGAGASPQGYPLPQGVAVPPRRRPAPLLRVPPPRWPTAPKDWIPGAVPAYPAEVVIGGRVARTTWRETMYHGGYPIKVTTAVKDTREANDWARELRVCSQLPDALPRDTTLHCLLVALLGVQG